MDSLDRSIDKVKAWLADIDAGFGTGGRRLAYRVRRAWLHRLRDSLSVEVAAHFDPQLPELPQEEVFRRREPEPGTAEVRLRRVRDAVRPRGPGA